MSGQNGAAPRNTDDPTGPSDPEDAPGERANANDIRIVVGHKPLVEMDVSKLRHRPDSEIPEGCHAESSG
ncbi:hypothetical protein ACI2K4_24025 [Micromonospora sp. NPDC050397]|uniref:hypothetical protein n=1 Tax=Micromonospora sp. NPDC050397 TaxID=3364279 RepID=UPI003850E5C0